MTTKPRKPRRGWITPRQFAKEDFFCLHAKPRFKSATIPVLVIDLSKESVEAMVQKAAHAIMEAPEPDAKTALEYTSFEVRAALASLGITARGAKGAK